MPNSPFQKSNWHAVATLITTLFLTITVISCTPISRESSASAGSSALQQSGQELNKEIFEAYNNVKSLPKATAQDAMTAVVGKYIKVGSTFSEAEIILKAADFSVSPHPATYPVKDWPYSDDIVAPLNVPLNRQPISVTKLSIDLRTAERLQYTTIFQVLVNYTISVL